MSRDRFLVLLTYMHFVNHMLVTNEEKDKDKLWKIRPSYTGKRGFYK